MLDAQASALAALQNAGYADAIAGERRVVVDHALASVSAEFRFSSGALARLGAVRAEPEGPFRPSFTQSLRNWELGAVSTPAQLARLRRDMSSTGAVPARPRAWNRPTQSGIRAVVLEVEPAPNNAYELGLGYATTEGLGLEAQWTRRNFSGRADALKVEAALGEIQQNLTIALTRPHAAGLGHALSFGVSAGREAPQAYTRQGIALHASVDASSRLRISRSYGVRLSADEYDDAAGGVSSALALSGFASLRSDTTEFSLDPRDGSIVEFRVEPAISTGDATIAFVRGIAEGRAV